MLCPGQAFGCVIWAFGNFMHPRYHFRESSSIHALKTMSCSFLTVKAATQQRRFMARLTGIPSFFLRTVPHNLAATSCPGTRCRCQDGGKMLRPERSAHDVEFAVEIS